MLVGPIPAGQWHLIGDGIVLDGADIRYDMIWRHDGSDTILWTLTHHFEPRTGENPFPATPFEADIDGAAANARAGDQLVWRFTALAPDAGTSRNAFIPNGDGARANGRIPSIKLPR